MKHFKGNIPNFIHLPSCRHTEFVMWTVQKKSSRESVDFINLIIKSIVLAGFVKVFSTLIKLAEIAGKVYLLDLKTPVKAFTKKLNNIQ